ncbi:MAG: DUF21 domain-containing protein, partial [Phycisphaerales bacterium]|nr:DUF21 domain-containing protein [Phycisphaerales bacterium]
LFCNLLINLSYFSVSVVVGQRLIRNGQHAAGGIFGLLSLGMLIILGEVVPKSLGVTQHRVIGRLVSLPLVAILRVLDPIMPPFHRVSRLVRRAVWPGLTSEPTIRSADLERAVEASHLTEDVVRHERQVLHNILDLSEISAEEVMRPRGTFVLLPAPIRLEHLRGRSPPGAFVAVRERDREEIDGVISMSDFTSVPTQSLESAAEEVVFVPWCATAADVLQLLRDRFCSVACVVNEYGESVGVVTHEDLLDTVLSPDPSRARRVLQRESVVRAEDGKYQIEGISTLRYLCRKLGLPFESESDSAVTVAALVSEELQRLPEAGDEIRWRGCHILVTESTRRGRFRAVLTPESP